MAQQAAKTTKRTGAMEAVALRNRFFYVYYRKMSLIFVAAMALCAFSLVCAFYFATKKTDPVYLPVTEDGRLIRTYPLSMASHPNKEIMEATVQQWALDGARKLFTYDYLNYATQISQAQGAFTVRGWNNYLAEFTASQNMNTVLKQKMIVNFVPQQPPVIKQERLVEGRLAWAVEFPAQIRYVAHEGSSLGFVQNGVVKMVIIRISTVDSAKGIGIDQVLFELDPEKSAK